MQKRIGLLLFVLFGTFILSHGQISANGDHKEVDTNYTTGKQNQVFVFKSLSEASLVFSPKEGGNWTYTWYEYDSQGKQFDKANPVFSQSGFSSTLNSLQEKGYLIEYTDGVEIKADTCWVFDYSSHQWDVLSLMPGYSNCSSLKLVYTIEDYLPLYYYDLSDKGVERILDLGLKGEVKVNGKVTGRTKDDKNEIWVEAPVEEIDYLLMVSDDFFGSAEKSLSIEEKDLKAVKAKVEIRVLDRDALNETEKGNISTPTDIGDLDYLITGSAPLEVKITNQSSVKATSFIWQIGPAYEEKENYTKFFDENIDQEFSELPGETQDQSVHHYIYFKAIHRGDDYVCEDSVKIGISLVQSAIEAPNVFTPNGDGINDEFRVAYKSIVSFHGWIFNRWGRKVFEWKNPAKGWDGRIGGREASPGAYYYRIVATGTEGKKYELEGHVSLLKGK